jgi:hypothetical protein
LDFVVGDLVYSSRVQAKIMAGSMDMPFCSGSVDPCLLHTHAFAIVADWHVFSLSKREEGLEANS